MYITISSRFELIFLEDDIASVEIKPGQYYTIESAQYTGQRLIFIKSISLHFSECSYTFSDF